MKFENNSKKNNMNRYLKFILPIFFTLISIFGFLSINEIYSIFKKGKEEKFIIIPENTSVIDISKILKKEKIISTPFLFQVYSKFKDYKNMKSGKFKLKTNMKYSDIINTITKNENVIYDEKITIYPGMDFFTLKEKYKSKLNNIKIEDVIYEINNKENFSKYSFIKEIDEKNLKNTYYPMEGLILDATFPIKNNATAKSIANDILKKSNDRILELKEEIKKSKLSFYDIFKIASVIQGETDDVDEMERISGVFHNRMKIQMRLEADPTRNYSKKIEKDMQEKNLKIDQSLVEGYNTYKVKMPNGPVCTPSIEAIRAAINPVFEGYYYFCADQETGKIFYGKDFENHKKNYIKD